MHGSAAPSHRGLRALQLGQVEATLSDLVRGGDPGAQRLWADQASDDQAISRAVGDLFRGASSLAALEQRLAELRQAMLDATAEAGRLRYRAEVVEVQATLKASGASTRRAGKSRLEREINELLTEASRHEDELRRLEEEHALLTAVITALSTSSAS